MSTPSAEIMVEVTTGTEKINSLHRISGELGKNKAILG
jgi:hypothetical protein